MKHFVLTLLGTAVALIITANVVNRFIANGFIVNDFKAALVAAVVIGFVNAFIRPILSFFTFPITFFTFGLFTFVINALMLILASKLTPGYGFVVRDFGAALIGSIVLSIVSSIINYFVRVVE
jgi:putative membrane protein